MAIQFSCPHCTALIRVPDSASGKTGQCPQCQTQLLVPAVEIPPPAVASNASEPQLNAAQPTVAQRFGRRKRHRAGILVPITLASVLLAALLHMVLQQAPELTGDLRATAVELPKLEPGVIPKRLIALPAESVDRVLEDLAEDPLRIATNVVETELRGTRQGIAVSVRPGIQTEFFRVSTRSLSELSKYYDQHAAELTAIQEKELRGSLQEFFESWETDTPKRIPEQAMLRYRDQIALNALVGGLGYQLAAVVGNATYRCVYERDRRFYFLLPPDTTQFEIVGRKHSNDTILFPGRYTVKMVSPK